MAVFHGVRIYDSWKQIHGIVEGADVPDNLAVDGAGNAVLELQVHLGDGVVGEDGSIRDITCKENPMLASNSSSTLYSQRYVHLRNAQLFLMS